MQKLNSISLDGLVPLLQMDLPLDYMRRKGICPIGVSDDRLIVAIASNDALMDAYNLAVTMNMIADIVIAPQQEIEKCINYFLSARMSTDDVAKRVEVKQSKKIERKELLLSAEDAPVVELVNSIIYRAVDSRASDIHIEPHSGSMQVRYRIDGVLFHEHTFSLDFLPPVVSRIKVMAGMDIAEHLKPQDGRIGIKVGDREIDIRVSVVPTQFGERVVLRLLYRKEGVIGLSEIGLQPEDVEVFLDVISSPFGMVLLTGPTGSGKTTTLYAMMKELNRPDVNIITIEDPVEYELEGISQIQVNRKAGMTFATGLRSVLRQDPDIMMIGEIRDRETAEMAIHSALTGHLVLSTLHTNDAPSAITRLVDMGIEPYLVSSSLLFVVAQRLVRKICTHCKFATGEEIDGYPMYRGKGCDACRNSGYMGRTAIFEYFIVDEDVRRTIVKNQDAAYIREYLIGRGMKTLRESGLQKVKQGITTMEEVLRVTHVRF